MDYTRIYIELMERANDRVIEGYTEKHHVVPKCMGGDDKPRNLVKLTPEEHYLAHLLLVKIYPKNCKLVFAANMMGATRKGNKVYGWLKRRNSESQKGSDNYFFGKKHSEEAKQIISESKKGTPLSEAHRENLSKSLKGRKKSAKHIENMAASQLGRKHSPETKAKISASWEIRRNCLDDKKDCYINPF